MEQNEKQNLIPCNYDLVSWETILLGDCNLGKKLRN